MENNVSRYLEDYLFSKDGYLLEFTVVYSLYDEKDRMLKKQVHEFQRYTDAKRHLDYAFGKGCHDVTIGCRPAKLTRESLYEILWDKYNERLMDSDNDDSHLNGELYL